MTNTTVERDEMHHARENAKGWFASIEDMLAEVDKHADQYGNDAPGFEESRRTIEESVLSVQVRSGWYVPGTAGEDRDLPEEYEILLTTGGPALRIFGRLSQHCEPETAEMQMQDWGTYWVRYPAPEATLLRFAAFFWFGG